MATRREVLKMTRFYTCTAAHRKGGLVRNAGLFSWLFDKPPSRKMPPLDEPLGGVTLPVPSPDYIRSPETRITRLSNGLTIASENTPGFTTSIGMFIDSGSIYESQSNSGVSHLLQRMAFNSTLNRSRRRLVNELEAIGTRVLAAASRERMTYSAEVIKTYIPEVVEIMVDTIRNAVFNPWEVKEQLALLKEDISETAQNPSMMVQEALHWVGYAGALGKPLMASESMLEFLDSDVLHDFVSKNYTAPRMVLAASGVEHDELVCLARPLLEDMPYVDTPGPPDTYYVGGDWRMQTDSDKTHIAIAFEEPGGWQNEKEAATSLVLRKLLGGGERFSTGGPGKGMYSRLTTRVLARYNEIHTITAFGSGYSNTGLVGIYSATDSDFSATLVDLIANELVTLASPEQVEEIELQRAKNAAISFVLMKFESRVETTDYIALQILTFGTRKPVNAFIDLVKSVTKQDISDMVEQMISRPVTVASWGDVERLPSYDDIASQFNYHL